ncbi:hypothetical protein FHU36_000704 [Nonomuraea muscovyensis]|uniref:SnoaL-like domain-containing protein n=1 Tax=Nonomuraea muscovyensis TaxID=1124761 RepID=A0A7X0EWV7_9ACTN|nr:nuclear transport factor 2 family protein [Nonomuraea muscovyensis]MBB6344195.1 hypothetical protein [Nonomuraea muscovyensis]
MISRSLAALLCALVAVTACSAGQGAPRLGEPSALPSSSASTPSSPSSSPSPSPPGSGASVPAGHRELVGRFVEAINRGETRRVADVFAEDATFDSVGRIYRGRAEIMGRFLEPEVIRAGGRYSLLRVAPGGAGRVVAEFDYDTGHGGKEHFTYDCAVSGGRFTDCVGRYV